MTGHIALAGVRLQRKKSVRLFRGLVGLPSEEATPKLEPSPAPQAIQSVTEIQAQIITAYDNKIKRKRGRPAVGDKAMTDAERKRRSRAQQTEQPARRALSKARLDRIMHDHRDEAGKMHGEFAVADVGSISDGIESDTGRVKASGTDPHTFERGGYRHIRELLRQWADRQNFYAMAKWDANEKEEYVEALTSRCCLQDFSCKFGDFTAQDPEDIAEHFQVEHIRDVHTLPDGDELETILPDDFCTEKFRCSFGDFVSETQDEVLNHFRADHKGYIRSMLRYHEPRPIRIPRTFSARDIFVTQPGYDVDN